MTTDGTGVNVGCKVACRVQHGQAKASEMTHPAWD